MITYMPIHFYLFIFFPPKQHMDVWKRIAASTDTERFWFMGML